MKKLKVCVLMGGKSPEYEISLASGREILKHLSPQKYEILPVVVSRDGKRWQIGAGKKLLHSPAGGEDKKIKNARLPDGQEKLKMKNGLEKSGKSFFHKWAKKVDLMFIAMHGPYGEDGRVQGMLETLGLPYTGSGVLASALGMNKIASRKLFEKEGIPVPRYLVFRKGQPATLIWKFFGKPPVFIKPHNQGSSVGGSIVRRKSDLSKALKRAFSYSDPVLVEEYLNGLEVTCGVLGNDKPYALPVVEIVPKNAFFDWEAKYTPGKSDEIVPARISSGLTKKVQETAVKVFKAVGARGFARADMILQGETPVVLEINTIPGLTPVSILPKEAAAAGLFYSELLEKIINLALDKVTFKFELENELC